MNISARGLVSAAVSLFAVSSLFGAAAAHADTTPATVDATCVMTGHGIFATAIDPGAVKLPVPDVLTVTGTVACVDAAGAPAAAGTFERTVTTPAEECTGDQSGDTSTTKVAWADGTVSTFTFDKTAVMKINGTASLVASGSVTADSARYAKDAISAGGLSVGIGCGTPVGETALDSTLVVRLTR